MRHDLPALKKRMRGRTCFNSKAASEAEIVAELERLAQGGLDLFCKGIWI